METFIHPKAEVHPSATIGAGTVIDAFCLVEEGAVIGSDCRIGKFVSVEKGSVVGNGVVISHGVSLFEGIRVEDEVFIGPSTVFTNVLNPRASDFRKNPVKELTILQKGCTTGANSTILAGVKIGRYAFVGASAVVLKDVGDYSLLVGNPAKRIGWMSKEGGRLHFGLNGTAKCPVSGHPYQLIDGRVSPDDF